MSSPVPASIQRLRLTIRGAVQGVGFRPFIYRLATELELKGWVNNSAQGVCVEVEGAPARLEQFLLRVETERPPRSFIQSLEPAWLDAQSATTFEIRESQAGGPRTTLVLPDIAACPDCLREVFEPGNRRYFYPFTNCTHCGPRFSIIESLPYDRANTSMKRFTMCQQCQAEYDDPGNRRFHAQPNACPACGPQLALLDRDGISSRNEPPPDRPTSYQLLALAAAALREGKILAVKGLGGFHLMVAALDERAVSRLRELKHREEKPLAVMMPSLAAVQAVCEVSPLEERLLRSPEAPIVLLHRRPTSGNPQPFPTVAPGNPNLGVMLPYTPLHHLLLALADFPVVATSGNLSDEPICTDEQEARERLGGIADLFLVHNRPIVRHVDDSIVRVMMGRELVLRRARGYAPLPIQVRSAECGVRSGVVLAVGAHLKNTVALAVGPQAFISQHIGDLETEQAFEAFRRVIADFESLYEAQPSVVVADAHPDYLSTKFARELADVGQASPPPSSGGGPARSSAPRTTPRYLSVQHHLAHVLACMADNELDPPLLGVSWDGTGYGLDGTVWGGEFFIVTADATERFAHLRQFRLPGGEAAIKEPRRAALGLLHALWGETALDRRDLAPVRAFSPAEARAMQTMLARALNSPLTSSAGRLFDAVAALVGLRQQVRFEGQAAMELEFALEGFQTNDAYPFSVLNSDLVESHSALRTPHSALVGSALLVDWAPMVEAVLADLERSVPVGEISARFHNGLVEAIIAVARHAGQERVTLSGGCFQNRYLTERAVRRLSEEGFRPYWHQRVPPNDGGIALGQVVAARGHSIPGTRSP